MSGAILARPRARPHYRLRRFGIEAGSVLFGLVLLIWSLGPIYNMVMVALSSHDDVFSSHVWPAAPNLHSFWVVVTESYWYLSHFWHQFGNSAYVGIGTTFFTLLIGSLTSFVIGRMRLHGGWIITNLAMVTYVIPASFVAIPFYRIMQIYGWSNNLWAVIAAYVVFATPYAIIVFQQYSVSIPIELDEIGTYRRRHPVAGVFPYLPATHGAGAGRSRHLRPSAGLERLPLPVPAAVVEAQHDRGSDPGAVPQQ